MANVENMVITQIRQVVYSSFNGKKSGNRTRKAENGIYFLVEGSAEFIFAENSISLKAGEGIILPNNSEYVYKRLSSSTVFIMNMVLSNCEDFSDYITFSIKDVASVLPCFSRINSLKNESLEASSAPKLFSEAYRLISVIAAETAQIPKPLADTISFINANFKNSKLKLSDIAEHSPYSLVHFRRIFKLYYGVSPIQYLNNHRIEVACNMLATTELSISDIAEACGFDNVYYFSRFFKIKTGCSPLNYRKSQAIVP